ncbi:phosphoribosyl-ATP pyrophosphatase /phosphoribosyl-AMP cyclohydrolase [Litorimonas taeanensis]|uniref:Histidine biosynthesis bifunctional protein HisIE n=1 Tax=Litorimonas taeanensis TaxID=568099 RepID=A0A420WKB1_9PROT|nr:bifunctional phosphoribosyl-AMP cyclohydrolase/phosphoribosyl-ATP diphosphatase HisIE [Litorimonas taeanensis]RKQ71389.1 phosphoribosyl-ATP pyrophosphatase /phosphoribosyl-AMP cyclohydrolase [Litorimonas taeanensis]
MTNILEQIDFDKGLGLVPAIIQDAKTLQVLMLGYMSKDSVEKTLNTQKVTFYSRSRQKLWTKGETSGHTLNLVSLEIDCDNDTLLVKANPIGPTCHEGTTSCFGNGGADGVGFLGYLDTLIKNRVGTSPEDSYTAKLLSGPLRRAAQKVGEEGVETALAAVAEDNAALLGESADLLYHLIVLLRAKGLSLNDAIEILQSRHK